MRSGRSFPKAHEGNGTSSECEKIRSRGTGWGKGNYCFSPPPPPSLYFLLNCRCVRLLARLLDLLAWKMVRKRSLRRLVHLKSCWMHKATYVNYSRYIIYLKVWLKLKCKWIIFSCDDHTFLVMFSITCIACSVSWNKMFIFVRKVVSWQSIIDWF